MAVHQ
jgi:hypothetical protein